MLNPYFIVINANKKIKKEGKKREREEDDCPNKRPFSRVMVK